MIEVIEVKTCDFAHDKPRKGADTVSFGLDGSEYLIELCAKDRAALERIMSEYIPHARKPQAPKTGKPGKPAAGYRPAATRQRSRDMRAWAAVQGITVSNRGRIPADIVARYEAANGTR